MFILSIYVLSVIIFSNLYPFLRNKDWLWLKIMLHNIEELIHTHVHTHTYTHTYKYIYIYTSCDIIS